MSSIKSLLKKATAQLHKRDLDKTELLLRKIFKTNPNSAEATHIKGLVAIERQQFDLAIQCISQAIKNKPNRQIYYVNLGRALYSVGKLEEALSTYKYATYLKPDDIESYNLQASISNTLGLYNLVEDNLRHVIRLNPKIAAAHNNLGSILLKLGRREESETSLLHSLELDPNHANTHCNLGLTYREMGRLVEAKGCLQRALEINPTLTEASNTYGLVLMGLGQFKKAEKNLRQALITNPRFTTAHDNLIFILAAGMIHSPQTTLNEQLQWDKIHGSEGRSHLMPVRAKEPITNRKLRIGYVSPDFRNNVVSYFITPLLASHDHEHFEIFCYATHNQDLSDEKTARLQSLADHWRFVDNIDDRSLAGLIQNDNIDILVDLTGHLKNNRLKAFTYRPAPVQTSYLGFIASTGLQAMDYWITDDILHPADTVEKTVETIFRLPRCWVCYEPPSDAPEVSPCPNTNQQVTFGSFSNISKLSPGVIETWSKILIALSGSKLLLMDFPFSDPKTKSLIIKQFENYGIASERLMTVGGTPYHKYLETYAKVDIVLDPFPRTGGTTTAEALWMGVPVITLAGQRYAERISTSKLIAIGQGDLVADDINDYINKAVELARNYELRKKLRLSLREIMTHSPLCDGKDFAATMETAFVSMWKQYNTT